MSPEMSSEAIEVITMAVDKFINVKNYEVSETIQVLTMLLPRFTLCRFSCNIRRTTVHNKCSPEQQQCKNT